VNIKNPTKSKLNEGNKGREVDELIEALATFDLPEGLILTFNQQDILKIYGKTIKAVLLGDGLKDYYYKVFSNSCFLSLPR